MITAEHRIRLQRLLGSDDSTTDAIAAQLMGAKVVLGMIETGRAEVPDVRAAQRRAARIAHLADELADQLREERVGADAVAGFSLDTEPDAIWDLGQIHADRKQAYRTFLAVLDRTASTFKQMAVSDETLRIAHMLPLAKDAGRSTAAVTLWPQLISIWEESGRRPAQTPGGAFHQFVSLAHEIVGIEPPSASTLRDAIRGRR